jgi:hypothetical protein
MTGKKSTKQQEGIEQVAEPQPTTRHCKFCEQDIDLVMWRHHLFYDHHGLTEETYDEYKLGQRRPKVFESVEVKPIPPPPEPPPPPPEPKVEIRLMDIKSNPRTVSVEARKLHVYHFVRGKWQAIPAPDAWLLLPTEGFPGRYAHLQFERKPEEAEKAKKRPAKAKK